MATERFDMKLDHDEKSIFARGAAIMGTSMAGFVRAAAKEKAQELIDRQSRIRLSAEDAKAFSAAIDAAFEPNPALSNALTASAKHVKRA